MTIEYRDYLGDGVYVCWVDKYSIRLTTENGIHTTNVIHLDPEVFCALIRYVNRVNSLETEKLKTEQDQTAQDQGETNPDANQKSPS